MISPDKKPLAAVLAADNAHCFALACVLMDLKEKAPKFLSAAEVIIYTQNLTQENKTALLKIMPLQIIDFKLPFDPSEIKTLQRYSELTMARYHCFDLLKAYKTVVWLDIDIVIKDEIWPILNYAQKSGVAHTRDGNLVGANFFSFVPEINFYAPCLNAGIMVLTDAFPNYQTMCGWCFEQTKKYASALNWIDQGILNYAYQVFNIKVELLPQAYNAHPVSSPVTSRQTVILHTMGPQKPWNTYPIKQWRLNYQNWLKLGGAPMPKQKQYLKMKFYYYIKLIIEKIPFLWTFFKRTIKKKSLYYNYTLIEQMENKWNLDYF